MSGNHLVIVQYIEFVQICISIHKSLFEKDATANWSEEIFEISAVETSNPTVYRINDLSGEEIDGPFYRKQLQKLIKIFTE